MPNSPVDPSDGSSGQIAVSQIAIGPLVPSVATFEQIFEEPSDNRHPVEVLADEFSARWRAGETPSIDEYLLRLPEHREMIRSLFTTISLIERMSRREYSDRQRHHRPIADQKVLGDFQIIREIGRGGMGVVYEAIQCSLARRVALKVLSSGISNSPQQLQRFRREAESAARLHHTNIVPVFGIGEEDGTHFYAMQFIDGVPLADAIKTVRHRSSVTRESIYGKGLQPSGPTGVLPDSNRGPVSGGSDHSANSAIDDPTILMAVTPDPESAAQVGDASAVHPNSDSVCPSAGHTNAPSLDRSHSQSSDSIQSESLSSTEESVDACFGVFADNGSMEYCLRIANLVAQVADGLDYAHQHGVLHRDIKPSNLMLDRRGDVWIMDFGLVKIIEQKDLTIAGEIVGTLRYMAPEQLEGRADVTTDIYALGLTLYELLTLKPAFDGDEAVTLAQRLRQSSFPRPRSINPTIPKDLETIILKATANEPFSRYPTAAMLAEDLRRFSEDRPILARRTTYPERLWRWSRRNPALAAATGSTILLLGLIAIVATAGWLTVKSALLDAQIAQKHDEMNLDAAMTAFDSILENVSSRGLPRSFAYDIPESEIGIAPSALSDADVQLLDRLLHFYGTFASQNAKNTRLRARTAEAHRRAGAILLRLGRLTEAEGDFRSAIDLLTRIPASDPHHAEIVVNTASLYNDLGELLLRRGEFHPTFKAHLEAIALLQEQPDSVKSLPAVRFELARATDLFASIDIRSGTDSGPRLPPSNRPNGPRPPFDRGHPPSAHGPNSDQGRPGPDGEPPDYLDQRLKNARPTALFSGGPSADGLAQILLDASNQFRALTREFPNNTEYQFRLAQCLRHRLVHAASNGKSNIAQETFLEATQILGGLQANFSDDPQYQFELADTLTQASRAQSDLDAEQSLYRSVSLARQLTKRFPRSTEYQLLLGTALARRAANQAAVGVPADAEESLQESMSTLEPLADRFPDQGTIQIPLAKTCQQLGDLLRMTAGNGDLAETKMERSRNVLQSAIERFEGYLSASQGKGAFNRQTISSLYFSLAETLTRQNCVEQAEEARKKAVAAGGPGPPPKPPTYE